MLYHLFDFLDTQYDLPGAGLFKYITFRAALAVVISLVITIVLGFRIITIIKNRQMLEKQRALGLPGEELKAKTPTMGGLLIHLAIILPCLLLCDLTNIYIQLMLLSTVWMGSIGFLDDYLKLTKGKEGLKGGYKVLGQVVLGLIVGLVMLYHPQVVVRVDKSQLDLTRHNIVDTVQVAIANTSEVKEMYYVKSTMTNVPFLKGNAFDYQYLLWFLGENAMIWVWIIFIPIVIFIVTAVSNAANLTDGIDGLAAGVSAIIGATLGLLAYISYLWEIREAWRSVELSQL